MIEGNSPSFLVVIAFDLKKKIFTYCKQVEELLPKLTEAAVKTNWKSQVCDQGVSSVEKEEDACLVVNSNEVLQTEGNHQFELEFGNLCDTCIEL